MTTEIAQKVEGIRDFRKILETVVKELGETYAADISQIVLSNPLDRNLFSICDYKLYPEADAAELPIHQSFPLPLEGLSLGAVTLARRTAFHENEINWIRITLAELANAIRFAQINDVVQRDTFRNTFLTEIQSLMQYSLGLGDALFMVVNILGKVLNVSRCLFICVDDEKSNWKCYEFWQREKVQSCQGFGWPTTDSPIVARSLLTSSPMTILESNESLRLEPVQQELQLLGVRSLLGVPLKSADATHGCIILQHCEARHDWTRGEIDMVQYVADAVSEALAKLPEEKRAHEPIMRLHQRDVVQKEGGEKESIIAVRRALRGALGQTSIPTAGKSGQTAKPAAPPVTPTAKVEPAQAAQAEVAPNAKVETAPATAAPSTPAKSPKTTQSKLKSRKEAAKQQQQQQAPPPPDANAAELAESLLKQAKASGDPQVADEVSSTLQGLLQSMGVAAPASSGAKASSAPPVVPDSAPAPAASPAPAEAAPDGNGGQWGNLDAIPTPTAGPGRSGLGGSMPMLSKRPSKDAAQSPLLAAFHKDKSRFQQQVEFVDGGLLEVDEAKAQAKFKQVLATSSATSDFIFATPGLDPRMLGRIDGWISQIEQKDKYESAHGMQVAEFSVAIGKVMNLPADELSTLRMAGILHDVGKLGLAAAVLQKPEEELSDHELLLIMKHPIDGSSLVEGFPELTHLAPIILAHHEEFDGNGFPVGLAGEAIPLAARIVHVASSYHGMISATKRRPGLSPQEAQQAMQSQAGKTYDPQVVDALIACVQQGLVAGVR